MGESSFSKGCGAGMGCVFGVILAGVAVVCGGVLLLGLGVNAVNDAARSAPSVHPPPAAQTSPATAPGRPERPARDLETITYAEYAQISDGMSYAEVARILKHDGRELSRVSLPSPAGRPIVTVIYVWENPGFLAGNLNVTFQDGRVVAKAQAGLR